VRKDEQRRGRRRPANAPAQRPAHSKQSAAATMPATDEHATGVSAKSQPEVVGSGSANAEGKAPAHRRGQPRTKTDDEKKQEAFDLVLTTIEALADERDTSEKVWGSMIKQALKRQRPGFNESYHGFRSFNQLLEEARDRKLLELEKDEKSGGYVVRATAG